MFRKTKNQIYENKNIPVFERVNLLIYILIFLLSINIVNSATYYVDAARPDDAGDGTSWNTAKQSITAGISLLLAGDTLKIRSGTYNEAFFITTSGTPGNPIKIETDDGNGNPGNVIIQNGAVTLHEDQSLVIFDEADYIIFDGRQENGFTLISSINHRFSMRLHAYPDGDAMNVTVRYVSFTGSVISTGPRDRSAFRSYGYNNPVIEHCIFQNVSNTQFILQIASNSGSNDPSPSRGGIVRYNKITGVTSDGYSAIDIKRHDGAKVYNNYLYSIIGAGDGSTVIRTRQGHDNKFFNNIVWIKSGETIRNFFQWRGMSTGDGSANRNEFYSNTLILDGTLSDGVMHASDQSDNNKCFNNLVIGNIDRFVCTWGGGETGSGNEVYNNVVTGTLNNWFETFAIQSDFSITSGGISGQGTSFINLNGNIPSPYWDLSASTDGTSSDLAFDYDGNPRSNPPDVGAFEFSASPPPAACDDGIDNDGDSLIDYDEDPGCLNASDDDEYNSHNATIYLYEDWENGTPSASWPYKDAPDSCPGTEWNGWDPGLASYCWAHPEWVQAGLSSLNAYSGNRSFFIYRAAGFAASPDIRKSFITPYPSKIHIRFYLYLNSNFINFSTPVGRFPGYHFIFTNSALSRTGMRIDMASAVEYGNLVCGKGAGGIPDDQPYIFFQLQDYDYNWMGGSFPNGCFNLFEHIDEWISVEFMFDTNNDTASIWVDGLLVYTAVGRITDPDFRLIQISNYMSDEDGPGFDTSYYIDDIVISDSYIGPLSTTPDIIPPIRSNSHPTDILTAGTTQTIISLTTDESATCRYETTPGIDYSSMVNTFTSTGSTSHSETITGLTNGNSYTYYIRCQDTSGNSNQNDYLITFDIDADSTPPVISNGTPLGILPIGTIQTTMTLITDESATCHYETTPGVDYSSMSNIFTTTGSTSHSQNITGLINGNSYSYYIRCQDTSGNSNQNDSLITFDVGEDVSSPVISNGFPSAELPIGTTQTSMSVTTDENSTCRYSNVNDTLYSNMSGEMTSIDNINHLSLLTNLQDGSSYTFYIRCIDEYSNANAEDYIVSFNIGESSSSSSSTSSGGSSSSGSSGGGSSSSSSSTSSSSGGSTPIIINHTTDNSIITDDGEVNENACIPNLDTSQWSECENNLQKRTINDIKGCLDDKLETRLCQENKDESEILRLNAKNIILNKIKDRRYKTQLDEYEYNGYFKTSEPVDTRSFLVIDENTNTFYVGRQVDSDNGTYYYSMELVDERTILEMQQEGLVKTDNSDSENSFMDRVKDSPSYPVFIGIIIFMIIITIISFLIFKRKRKVEGDEEIKYG